jgi:hypothetical protein
MAFDINAPSGTLSCLFNETCGINGGRSEQWVLHAPANAHFEQQADVLVIVGGTVTDEIRMNQCATSAGGSTLTCTIGLSGVRQNVRLNAGATLRIAPIVTVSSNALAGSFPTTMSGSAWVRDRWGTHARRSLSDTNVFRMTNELLVRPPAPIVSKVDESSGAAVITGTGYPGAQLVAKDDNGKIVGSVTVAQNGAFKLDLGADAVGKPGNLSLTQTVQNLTSSATTVRVAKLPVVSPLVAGAGGLASVALGVIALTRRLRR